MPSHDFAVFLIASRIPAPPAAISSGDTQLAAVACGEFSGAAGTFGVSFTPATTGFLGSGSVVPGWRVVVAP
ncbi:hypothetical protein [uncultured Mobiluncus sp.]|uniref:hypothetical protein n=1 Tax=uncultured Mobiluncus sp. TaxID=293425 RepID=UPI002606FCB7|nr:hypothetical protein [uncultured Mobiluncus sp.]